MNELAVLGSAVVLLVIGLQGTRNILHESMKMASDRFDDRIREFTVWQLFYSDSDSHDKQSWYDWAADWATWLSPSEQEELWEHENEATYNGDR